MKEEYYTQTEISLPISSDDIIVGDAYRPLTQWSYDVTERIDDLDATVDTYRNLVDSVIGRLEPVVIEPLSETVAALERRIEELEIAVQRLSQINPTMLSGLL